MCYSAMVESSFSRYVRETGAQMDIDQFEEIFGWREREPGLRILRAVERWFDDPKTPAEQRVAALIAKHNGAQVTKLEQEIFAQRKRIADAIAGQRVCEVRGVADAQYAAVGDTVLPAHVDQNRDALQADKSIFEEITGGTDHIILGKQNAGHDPMVLRLSAISARLQREVMGPERPDDVPGAFRPG